MTHFEEASGLKENPSPIIEKEGVGGGRAKAKQSEEKS